MAEARARDIQLGEVEGFASEPGLGGVGEVDGEEVVVGGRTYMEEKGITVPAVEKLRKVLPNCDINH